MRKPDGIEAIYTTAKGDALPLAFVYEQRAYYFDPEVFFDSDSTAHTAFDGTDAVEGIAANKELDSAVRRYVSERGDVWISADFREQVAYIANGEE